MKEDKKPKAACSLRAVRNLRAALGTLAVLAFALSLPAGCRLSQDLDPAVYTVTFDPDSGIFSKKLHVWVKEGETVKKPENPAKEGYIFKGWYGGDAEYDFSAPVRSSLTLQAKYDPVPPGLYTVTFEPNGGSFSGQPQVQVEDGDTVARPQDPELAGSSFEGWYTDDGTFEYKYDFAVPVTRDITLYAKYEEVPEGRHLVKFDPNGGTLYAEGQVQVEDGDTVARPQDPELAGSSFEGWYTDDGTFEYRYDFAVPVTRDITLYAKWKTGHTVVFDSNGGTTVPVQLVTEGGTVTEPPAPEKAGHSFGGWYTDTDGYDRYGFDTPVTGNMTLYAAWEAVPEGWHRVTFDPNGGTLSGERQVQVRDGDTVKRPEDPVMKGSIFEGWYTGNGRYDFSAPVTEDMTLYAKWDMAVYTVTYVLNGGTGTPPPAQSVEAGKSVTLPGGTGIEKPGFLFDGWNTKADGTGTNYSAGAVYAPTASITLYAKWLTAYTVTYDINGGTGTAPQPQTVEAGKSVTLPDGSGFSKQGYTLGGWSMEADGTGATYGASASYKPEASITLYAAWAVPEGWHLVTFDPSGGILSGEGQVQVKDGETVAEPEPPVKQGSIFEGWYTDTSGSSRYDFSMPVTGDMTLYAKWTPVLSGTVTISGDAVVGRTLTANATLAGTGTVAYRWKRGSTDVGTDSSTYLIVIADAGSPITVTVTRTGNAGEITSNPTAPVSNNGDGGINITFDLSDESPADYTITQPITGNTQVPVSVADAARYDTGSITWYYRGQAITGGISGTYGQTLSIGRVIGTTMLGEGTHFVTVEATVNGVPYSGRITFTIKL